MILFFSFPPPCLFPSLVRLDSRFSPSPVCPFLRLFYFFQQSHNTHWRRRRKEGEEEGGGGRQQQQQQQLKQQQQQQLKQQQQQQQQQQQLKQQQQQQLKQRHGIGQHSSCGQTEKRSRETDRQTDITKTIATRCAKVNSCHAPICCFSSAMSARSSLM